uniref:PGG domain-containing protein n=1 Tax=Chenopodium quinoa TaxID=63459 RepID=A0A803MYF3_CHEQI
MEKTMYRAAMEGNVDFLRVVRDREIETGCWNKHFLGSLTSQKNNIIHIASLYDQYDFLKKGFGLFNFSPLMIASTNTNGDTPLHVASRKGNKKIVRLLVEAFNELVFGEVEIFNELGGVSSEAAEGEEKRPWRVKNMEGNTPLHEALINGKIEVATYLVEVDPLLASFVNNNGETPLHLAIKYNVDGDKKLAIDTIELMNKKQASLSYKGSRASLQSHFRAIEIMLDEHPECLETCDPKGKTVLHLLKFQSYDEAKKFFRKNPRILNLKDQQDHMGNTPAHIAVMNCIERISKQSNKVLGGQDGRVTTMKTSQLISLKNDEQGNNEENTLTPPIVMNCKKNILDEQMVIKRDDDIIGVIRALLESSTNFSLKNKEGLSATALFQQVKSHFSCTGLLPRLDREIDGLLAENKHGWMDEKTISKDLEVANVNSLSQETESCIKQGFLSITDLLYKLLKACEIKHSDYTHETMKCASCFNCNHTERPESPRTKSTCCYHKIEGLMMELFEKNPLYIYETNSRGETPLHILVRVQELQISESLLNQIKNSYEKADELDVYCPPWTVKNMEGNTPIHEALLHISPKYKNEGVIKFLMECEPHVFQRHDEQECDCDIISVYLNNQRETPLHVFCRSQEKCDDVKMIKDIIEANTWAATYRDATGLTPLLTAAKIGQIEVVQQFWEISPESAQLRDSEGRTFWHMMDMAEATKEEEEKLIRKAKEIEMIARLSSETDNVGNPPFVQAIIDHNYNLAQVLSQITEKCVKKVLNEKPISMRYILFILSIIVSYLPEKLEKKLWKKMKNVGVKSIFGVPKSEISGYTNTIGVIAALLATIAFQGAFAVPGSYSDKGHPNLLEKSNHLNKHDASLQFLRIAAFWVFMLADLLTMCLSMMVLFCLQWILTGNDKEKFIITDLCLLLLNMAFMTTIIAFMMGVFASTHHIASFLSITTVVVCSAVMVLLQKWVVMNPIQCVFLTGYVAIMVTFEFVFSSKVATSVSNKFKCICNRLFFQKS